jgi:hypothetical protein
MPPLVLCLLAMTAAALAATANDSSAAATSASIPEEAAAVPESFDPAECASVTVRRGELIAPHRWYTPPAPFVAAQNTPQSQPTTSRRSAMAVRGTFNADAVHALQCIDGDCNNERVPNAVHCVVERSRISAGGPIASKPQTLEWRCYVERPSWLAANVQFYDVRPECRSTIDGTPLRLPAPTGVLNGHRRQRKHAVLRYADLVDSHAPATLDPLPNLLSVSVADDSTVEGGEGVECPFEVKLREVSLADFVKLRRKLHFADAETLATAAVSAIKDSASTNDAADTAEAADEEQHTVAAEVCRITYKVRLIYPMAAILSVVSIIAVIIMFLFVIVLGTNNRKSRDEVARHRVSRELKKLETEAGAAFAAAGNLRASGPAATTRPQAAMDNRNVIERGLAEGLTIDELLLREELAKSRDARTAPPGLATAEFVRQRQARRLTAVAAPDGHVPHTAVAHMPPASAARGGVHYHGDPQQHAASYPEQGSWGYNIDQVISDRGAA